MRIMEFSAFLQYRHADPKETGVKSQRPEGSGKVIATMMIFGRPWMPLASGKGKRNESGLMAQCCFGVFDLLDAPNEIHLHLGDHVSS